MSDPTRRATAARKLASQYARSVIEASVDPLVTISPDGKITDVNEATVKVTGVPREQLIGTHFSNYVTEPEKARAGFEVFDKGFVTDYPLTIREFIFATGHFTERDPDPNPKVMVLDLRLPLVDGMDVLRRVKSDARTRSVPAVVLTSSREEMDIVESYELGANSYIVKPVDFEQFTESVRTLGMYWLLLNELPRVSGS
jgi:CheY-like chemotaxis protein